MITTISKPFKKLTLEEIAKLWKHGNLVPFNG